MITLFGENYYINLENIDKYVNIQTPNKQSCKPFAKSS